MQSPNRQRDIYITRAILRGQSVASVSKQHGIGKSRGSQVMTRILEQADDNSRDKPYNRLIGPLREMRADKSYLWMVDYLAETWGIE